MTTGQITNESKAPREKIEERLIKLPLNGTKTHPLSSHAIGVLEQLANGPLRKHTINPGVYNRLNREDLAELDVRTGMISITQPGRDFLASRHVVR